MHTCTAKIIEMFHNDDTDRIFKSEEEADFAKNQRTVREWFRHKVEIEEGQILESPAGRLVVVLTFLTHYDFEVLSKVNLDYNRNINRKNLSRIIKGMVTERWNLTGETITFDINGSNTNGNHRLSAGVIVTAEKPDLKIPALLVFGTKPITMKYIDSGRSRSDHERFTIAKGNKAYPKGLSGLLRTIYEWEQSIIANRQFETVSKLESPISDELEEMYDRDPQFFIDCAKIGDRCAFLGSAKSIGFAAYLVLSQDREKGKLFLDQLQTGNITDGVILTLRERLLRLKREGKKLNYNNITASVFKTWRRWLSGKKDGKRLSLVMYDPDKDYFPPLDMYKK